MRAFLVLLGISVLAPVKSDAVEPAKARVYVNKMGDFGSYLAAAFLVKGVPVTVVMDRRQADFELVGNSESKDPNWAEVIFLKRGLSTEAATISLINLRRAEVIYAYAYHMGQAYNGKQSAAESCAKHLREAIVKGRVDLRRSTNPGDDERPAGETTAVPPSEAGAAPAIAPEQLLMSVMVNSTPSDASVEVDDYPAGKTPTNVRLAAGTYRFKVSKPGFQAWTQKIVVEPAKAQTLGVNLVQVVR
jgi:hypothetical protein